MLNQKNPCKRHSYFSFPSWRFVHLPLFWNFCLKHHVISSYVISSWWPFQRYHRELGRKVFPDANKAGSSSAQLKMWKGWKEGCCCYIGRFIVSSSYPAISMISHSSWIMEFYFSGIPGVLLGTYYYINIIRYWCIPYLYPCHSLSSINSVLE